MGLSNSPNLKKCSFRWQCPLSSPAICLACSLLNFTNSAVLSAEVPSKKLFACFCPEMVCQCAFLACVLVRNKPLLNPITSLFSTFSMHSGKSIGRKQISFMFMYYSNSEYMKGRLFPYEFVIRSMQQKNYVILIFNLGPILTSINSLCIFYQCHTCCSFAVMCHKW